MCRASSTILGAVAVLNKMVSPPLESQPQREYEIDGAQFSNLEEFMVLLDSILVQARLIPNDGIRLGGLDGLYDALAGWFNEQQEEDDSWPPGKPPSFIVRWKNSAISRERLGAPLLSIADKERQLEKFSSDPLWITFSHRKESEQQIRDEIKRMEQGERVDPTAFDEVVDVFRAHAPGSPEMDNEVSGVILLLE